MEQCKPKSFEECPRYIPERTIIDDCDNFNPIYNSLNTKKIKPKYFIATQFYKNNFFYLLLLLIFILLSIIINEYMS